jgi:hypothetical protein
MVVLPGHDPTIEEQRRSGDSRMIRRMPSPRSLDAFEAVRAPGLALPDVEAAKRYDGSPVLKVRGVFMAAIATHPSAEPDTLVVRAEFETRALLLEDAPETYYVTDYYERYPVVLARLSRIDADALHDLLASSWRLSVAKTRPGRKIKKPGRDAGP